MRVALVVTRSDVFGGAVTHVRDLAVGLRHRGHDVAVVIGGRGIMVDHIRAHDVDVHPLADLVRDIDPVRDTRALRALLTTLRSLRPDVVHAHTAKSGLLARVAARRLGLPCVYTPHAWAFMPGVPEPSRSRYLHIERLASRLPGTLIDVCEFERDVALQAGVGREQQHVVVPNGVPDGPIAKAVAADGRPHIVMVARFEPQKDHSTLLRALAQIEHLPWRATLVGDGAGRSAQQDLAARLGLAGRVDFAGEVNAVERVLADAQVAVLSSHWEAFPLTVLESMRAGLPVVATSVGGVPEAVRHASTGLLVAHADVRGLGSALERTVQDSALRSRLGAAGRARYEQSFTVERMVDATVPVYERTVAAHRDATSRRHATEAARVAVHAGRRATTGVRAGPDFLVIGTQKGGTTALYRYLAQHPGIAPATAKEVHYFDLNYHRGPAWYRAHFPVRLREGASRRKLTGEASPYYLFHPLVPARVARDHPDARLIVLLRDPVARAYSHYHHERAKGREHLSFEEAVEAEPRRLTASVEAQVRRGAHPPVHRRYSYLARGHYAEQLLEWLAFFPAEQLLILRSEDLSTQPQHALDRVVAFLGLPPRQLDAFPSHNALRYPPLHPDTRTQLDEHFSPHNDRLRELTGLPELAW